MINQKNKMLAYPIICKSTCIKSISRWIPKHINWVVIITDHAVKKRYVAPLKAILKKNNLNPLIISFSPGEKSKQIHTKCLIETRMLSHHCDRNTLIIALGGGVVSDLAGFVASTYLRGIPYINIPTTLLAMVDSSVGGKTGINTEQGKNLIGSFWQPHAVLIDPHYLKSLSKKQLINGLIESVKMFITSDSKSFDYFEKNIEKILSYDEKSIQSIIQRSIKIKSMIVKEDEKDTACRAILNLGHTLGHALESLSHYTLLHGYAVGYGLLVEAKISQLLGLLHDESYLRIESLLKKMNIHKSYLKQFNFNQLIKKMMMDKKSKKGKTHYVLLKEIGLVYQVKNRFAHPVDLTLIKQAYLG
ncbi:MAG: 3-dehydroquinate synthase [Gammaproteobacteria bacterium]|nr:3-dehydroquinate synthase [Gammaproteobacteria bacterium]